MRRVIFSCSITLGGACGKVLRDVTLRAKKGRKQGSGEKDPSAFKLGDRMVIKNGEIMKEVKPITGGY